MYDVVVFMWHCMPLVCIPSYCVMVRCNDIHIAKAFQYALLSLVGPSSPFRIGSHIGRDNGCADFVRSESEAQLLVICV